MKKEDIQFLQQLQAKLNAADNDPKMHDYQANPRFWVVMDQEEVESEYGEPRVFDEDNLVTFTAHGYIEWVEDEVYQVDKDEMYKQWNTVDKSDIQNVCDFASDKFGHNTKIIYIQLQDCIARNTLFLTKEAAQKHIELNHHHYRNPRTYAMTAWRSPEFERFFDLFKQFDFSQLKND